MDINLQAVLIGFHCVDNPKQKIPKPLLVYILCENVLTVNGLKDLMQKIQTGGTL
ncbi:hypothetical protein [Dolichospermum circinale]|uniref:hypothetical protein n=1 Tax=Dolichospermum circinale TaxID=109265 RepID=UPI00232A9E6C|nr:hypothetical protein [Dolichospermum circinale]MDB9463048.1 hypothetical protein [Dolichospermum circinale CS-541/04]MDB9546129.1 hypothetical protein [Dolichospermum circinale CS-1031]